MDNPKAEEDADDKMEDYHLSSSRMSQLREMSSSGSVLGDILGDLGNNSTVSSPPEISDTCVSSAENSLSLAPEEDILMDSVKTGNAVDLIVKPTDDPGISSDSLSLAPLNIPDEDIVMDSLKTGNVVDLLVKPTDDPGISSDLEQELLSEDIMDQKPCVISARDTRDVNKSEDSVVNETCLSQTYGDKSNNTDNLQTSCAAQKTEDISDHIIMDLIPSENKIVDSELNSDTVLLQMPVEMFNKLDDNAHTTVNQESEKVSANAESMLKNEKSTTTSLQCPSEETNLTEHNLQIPLKITSVDEKFKQDSISTMEFMQDIEIKIENSEDSAIAFQPKCEEDNLLHNLTPDLKNHGTSEDKNATYADLFTNEGARIVVNNKEAIVLKWYDMEPQKAEDETSVADQTLETTTGDANIETKTELCSVKIEVVEETSNIDNIDLLSQVSTEDKKEILLDSNSECMKKIEYIAQDLNNTSRTTQSQEEKPNEVKNCSEVSQLTNTEQEVKEVIGLIIEGIENNESKRENSEVDIKTTPSQSYDERFEIQEKCVERNDQKIEILTTSIDNTSEIVNTDDITQASTSVVCKTESEVECNVKLPISQCQGDESNKLSSEVASPPHINNLGITVDNTVDAFAMKTECDSEILSQQYNHDLLCKSENVDVPQITELVQGQVAASESEIKDTKTSVETSLPQLHSDLRITEIKTENVLDNSSKQNESTADKEGSTEASVVRNCDAVVITDSVSIKEATMLTSQNNSPLISTTTDNSIAKITETDSVSFKTVESNLSSDLPTTSSISFHSLENIEKNSNEKEVASENVEVKLQENKTVDQVSMLTSVLEKYSETQLKVESDTEKKVSPTNSLQVTDIICTQSNAVDICRTTFTEIEASNMLTVKEDTELESSKTHDIEMEINSIASDNVIPEMKDVPEIKIIKDNVNLTTPVFEEIKSEFITEQPESTISDLKDKIFVATENGEIVIMLRVKTLPLETNRIESVQMNSRLEGLNSNTESKSESIKSENVLLSGEDLKVDKQVVQVVSTSIVSNSPHDERKVLEVEEVDQAAKTLNVETFATTVAKNEDLSSAESYKKLEAVILLSDNVKINTEEVKTESHNLLTTLETVKPEIESPSVAGMNTIDLDVHATQGVAKVLSMTETDVKKEEENSMNLETTPEVNMPEEMIVAATKANNSSITSLGITEGDIKKEEESFEGVETGPEVSMPEQNIVAAIRTTKSEITSLDKIEVEIKKEEAIFVCVEANLEASNPEEIVVVAAKATCSDILNLDLTEKTISLESLIKTDTGEVDSKNSETIPEVSESEEVPIAAIKATEEVPIAAIKATEEKFSVPPLIAADAWKEKVKTENVELMPEVSKPEEVITITAMTRDLDSCTTAFTKESVPLTSITETDCTKIEVNPEKIEAISEANNSEDISITGTKTTEEISSLAPLTEVKEEEKSEILEIMPEASKPEEFMKVATLASDLQIFSSDVTEATICSTTAANTEKDKLKNKDTSPETNKPEKALLITTKASDLEISSSNVIHETISIPTCTKIDANQVQPKLENIETISEVSKTEEILIVANKSCDLEITSDITKESVPLLNLTETNVHNIEEKSKNLKHKPEVINKTSLEILSSDVTEATDPVLTETGVCKTEEIFKTLETTCKAIKPVGVSKASDLDIPALRVTEKTALTPPVTETDVDRIKENVLETAPNSNDSKSEVKLSTTTVNLDLEIPVSDKQIVSSLSIPETYDTKDAENFRNIETSVETIKTKSEIPAEATNTTDSKQLSSALVDSSVNPTSLPVVTVCHEVKNIMTSDIHISSQEVNADLLLTQPKLEIPTSASTNDSVSFSSISESGREVAENSSMLEAIPEETRLDIKHVDTGSDTMISSDIPEKVASPVISIENCSNKIEERHTNVQACFEDSKSDIEATLLATKTEELVTSSLVTDDMNENDISAVEESIMNVDVDLEDDKPELEALLLATDPSDFEVTSKADNHINTEASNEDIKPEIEDQSSDTSDLSKTAETICVKETGSSTVEESTSIHEESKTKIEDLPLSTDPGKLDAAIAAAEPSLADKVKEEEQYVKLETSPKPEMEVSLLHAGTSEVKVSSVIETDITKDTEHLTNIETSCEVNKADTEALLTVGVTSEIVTIVDDIPSVSKTDVGQKAERTTEEVSEIEEEARLADNNTCELMGTSCMLPEASSFSENDFSSVVESIMNVEDSHEENKSEMEDLLLATDPSDFENNSVAEIVTNADDHIKMEASHEDIKPEIENELLFTCTTDVKNETEVSVNETGIGKEAEQQVTTSFEVNKPDIATPITASVLNTTNVEIVSETDVCQETDTQRKPEFAVLLQVVHTNELKSDCIAAEDSSLVKTDFIHETEHPTNVEIGSKDSKTVLEPSIEDSKTVLEPSIEDSKTVLEPSIEASNACALMETSNEAIISTTIAANDEKKAEICLKENTQTKTEDDPINVCTGSDIIISSVMSFKEESNIETTVSSNQEEQHNTPQAISEEIGIGEHHLETMSNDRISTSLSKESKNVQAGSAELTANSGDNTSMPSRLVSDTEVCEEDICVDGKLQETTEEETLNATDVTVIPASVTASSEEVCDEEPVTCSVQTEKSESKVDNKEAIELTSSSDAKSTFEIISKPTNDEDIHNIEATDSINDKNSDSADLSEPDNAKEETQESDYKSEIIILSSTSLAQQENNFELETEPTNEDKEVSEPLESEMKSNTENSISIDTIEVKETKIKEVPTPVKEKVLKIVTNEGIVQYIKIPVSFNIPNIAQMFSQSDNNVETLQIQKEASPEKLKEDIVCKGCETKLTRHDIYHPCVVNWCRFCEESLPTSAIFELHTIEKHLINMRTCAFCEKELASLQHLENHLKIHTHFRLAPSVCVGCKTQFRTNEGRREHSCSLPLLCTICNITLPNEARLLHHQVTQHKVSSGGRLSRQPSAEVQEVQAQMEENVNVEMSKQTSAGVEINDVSTLVEVEKEDVNKDDKTEEEEGTERSYTPPDTVSLTSSQTSEIISDDVGETLERVIAEVVKLNNSSESEHSYEKVWNIVMNNDLNTDISKTMKENLEAAPVELINQEKNLPDSQQTTTKEVEEIPMSSEDDKSGEESTSVVENIEISSTESETEKDEKSGKKTTNTKPENEEIEYISETSSVEEAKLLVQLTEFLDVNKMKSELEPQKQISDAESTKMKFVCDICDRGLKTESDLVSHRAWHFESCAAPKNTDVPDPSPLYDVYDTAVEAKKEVSKVENDKVELLSSTENNQNTTTVELPKPIQLTMNSTDDEILECLSQIQEETTGIREYILPDQIGKIISEVEASAIATIALESREEVKQQIDIKVDTEELSKELSKMNEDVFNEAMDREIACDLGAKSVTTADLEATPDLVVQNVTLGDVDTSSQAQQEMTVSDSQDIENECTVSNSQEIETDITAQVQDVIENALSSVYEKEQREAENCSVSIKSDVAASIVKDLSTSIATALSGHHTPHISSQEVTIEEPTSTVPCPHCSQSFSNFTTLNSHFIDAKFCKFCESLFPKDYELHMVEYHSLDKICQFCDKNFRHAKDLSSHIKIHTLLQFKPWVCSKCNGAFNKTDYLKHNKCQASHKNKTVMELNLFCDQCKIYFQSDVSLENHMIENHSIKDICPICKEKFKSLLDLVTHLGSHNSIKEIAYKCQKCLLNTTNESEFDNHQCIQDPQDLNVTSASSSDDNLLCQFCNDGFATEEDKLLHVCTKEKCDTNKCETCDITFDSRPKFEEHMMSEHSSRNVCQFCSKKFQNITALKSHIKIHTSLKHPLISLSPVKRIHEENCNEEPIKRPQRKKSKPENEVEAQEDLYCKVCDVKYLKRDSFELHMMEFHSSIDTCQFCDKKFRNRTSLSQHITIHTKLHHLPHKCETCSARFSKAAELIVHHMGPCQVFTCEECNVVFECQEDYKKHSTEQHALSCEFCQEYFKTKQELTSHIKIHSIKDALICKDCNVQFKTILDKSSHVCSPMKQEKSEFHCEICDQTFKSKYILDKHSKKHETKPDIPQYPLKKCKHCFRTFKSDQYLNVHLKYCKDNKKPSFQRKCKICKVEFKNTLDMTKHRCNPQELFCKFCKITYKNKKEFEQHMIENHTTPDTCQFCNQKFKQAQSLLLHLTKHTTIKPLQLKCEHCKLKYFQGEEFESHDCVARKDFKCCVCSKEFAQAYWLASHLIKQHNIMQYLPEVCGTCDTQFSNRRQLHRHPCPVGLPQDEPYVSLPFGDETVASVNIKQEIDIKQEPLWDDSAYDGSCEAGASSQGVLCPHCEEVYESKNKLNEHLCKVNYCKRCSKSLSSSKAFNLHMISLHCTEKTCQFCDRVFKSTNGLLKHISLHTSIKHKLFDKYSTAAKSKVTEKETDKMSTFCKICDKTLSSRQGFESHMMSKHCMQSTCQFCDKVFPKKENLLAHIATHTKLPYRLYNRCLKCDKKFLDDLQEIYHRCPMDRKSENMEKPAESENSESDKIEANTSEATDKKKCLICNKKFTNKSGFEKHMMELHQMKMTCQFCGIVCKKRSGLIKHLTKHTSIQAKSVCMLCSDLRDVDNHNCSQKTDNVEASPKKQQMNDVPEVAVRKRTREDKLLEDLEDSSSSLDYENPAKLLKGAADSVKCLLCITMFDSKEDMHSHLRNHHRVDVNSLLQLQGVKVAGEESTIPPEISDKDFTCLHCNIKFANQAELRLHGQKARVYCEFCKKTYPSQGEYESHMLEQHSMGRTCQFCGAQFSSKTGLLLHLRKHTSLKPIYFKCFGCGEKFRTKIERQRHDCLAWKCDDCNKKFDSEEALTVHSESHKPQPKFKCELCDSSFTTTALMNEHVKTSHPQNEPQKETRKRGRPLRVTQASKHSRVEVEEPEESFQCEGHCTMTFASQNLLDVHKKSICQICKKEFKTPKECEQHQAEHNSFACQLCDQKFAKQICLNKHLSWHDLNDAKSSTAAPEPLPPRRAVASTAKPPPQLFTCDTCGKEVKSNFALQMHKKTHKVFQCELCTRVFASAQKLSAHTRLHPPPVSVEEDSDDDVVVILEVAPTTTTGGQFVLLD